MGRSPYLPREIMMSEIVLAVYAVAGACCCVHVIVCMWKGGLGSHLCSSLVGRSCGSVRVVPQIPGHFCVWVPPSAGLRFGRRKIANYKLQITCLNI